jgi:hypothetical protein
MSMGGRKGSGLRVGRRINHRLTRKELSKVTADSRETVLASVRRNSYHETATPSYHHATVETDPVPSACCQNVGSSLISPHWPFQEDPKLRLSCPFYESSWYAKLSD